MAATETIIKKENQTEATEVMDFLEELDQSEKKEFMAFIHGVQFTKNMNRQSKTATQGV